VDYYRQKAILSNQLGRQVGLDNSMDISAYHPVAAQVIARDPTLWYQTIQVGKGSADGVSRNDPVTGDGALVGKVTTVDANVSVVTLITDHSYAVAAEVEDRSGDTGVLVPAVGNPNQLLLQDLNPHAPVQVNQPVITAGFKSGALDSLYPPGIPIGQVSNADQNDLLNNQQVQVSPAADLRHLSVVQILTRPHPGGTVRAQVP
jgi:rod shape-determining protein MreC